jgi:hypothetical protein
MLLKPSYRKKEDLREFASYIKKIQREIGFKVSSRGWAYILEQKRLINKDQFDRIATLINKCRKEGFLPIDFVAEESARQFQGVEVPASVSVIQDFGSWLRGTLNAAEHYDLDWWEGEDYYLQCVVEKIDLVTLFGPVCSDYHIPIANSKGWGSMLQRAEYARRFKEAEDRGMECVLLYCGDHDPDGLRISEFIRNNLIDLKNIQWRDGQDGYDPRNLKIERFGLNYDFIKENNLSWIDNLITGSGKNLASPNHHNHNMNYVQDYLREIGERKCEANAIVVMPDSARELMTDTIEFYLGSDALDRFESKRDDVRTELEDFLSETGIGASIDSALQKIEDHE